MERAGWCNQQRLRLRQAAIPGEEKESTPQGAPQYWRVDLFEELCRAGADRVGAEGFCELCCETYGGFGHGWSGC